MEERKHKAFLRFVSRLVDVPAIYSKRELREFLDRASFDFPGLVKIIQEYIHLAERAESDVKDKLSNLRTHRVAGISSSALFDRPTSDMHLFDLLRSKKLFTTNAELAEFARRILPRMERRRFDKMSRGDIAVRVIEHLEARKPETRMRLEKAMRDALVELSRSPKKRARKRSFFQEWEKIIKGGDL